jgi:uncharacterized membrane protein
VRQGKAYAWGALGILVLVPTLLYPFKAYPARREHLESEGFTLNGYAYMDTMQLNMNGTLADLDGDKALIKYMQTNIEGYPVIVEDIKINEQREYFWHGRIASYTGLPIVLGWGNHLHQQYQHQFIELDEREADMRLFFSTSDPNEIIRIIEKYNIEYIVFGVMENYNTSEATKNAFKKLETAENYLYLEIVFQEKGTLLYKVVRNN